MNRERYPDDVEVAWQRWLAERPLSVQRLAARFGPGTRLETHDGAVFVVAYGEEADGTAVLEVSVTDPAVDYETAVATRRPICSCCGPSERGGAA